MPVPGTLVAGAEVVFDVRLPAHVDELEFHLSLDGGESWPVRLEAASRAGSVTVVLPPLCTPAAVLRLRAGGEEDGEEFEHDLAVSSPFELRLATPAEESPAAVVKADRGSPARAGDRVAIEWSVEEGLVPAALPEPSPSGLESDRPALSEVDDAEAAVAPPGERRPAAPVRVDRSAGGDPETLRAAFPGGSPLALRLPAPVPLRN